MQYPTTFMTSTMSGTRDGLVWLYRTMVLSFRGWLIHWSMPPCCMTRAVVILG
ncbi:hypothetical protein LINPERPRIM_LOCUS21783 [Linum perenne]